MSSPAQRYLAVSIETARLQVTLAHPRLVGSRTELEGEHRRLRGELETIRAAHADLPDQRLGLAAPLARDLLWLTASPYIDERFRDLIARANDNLLYHYVDGALCQRLFGRGTAREEVVELVRPGGELHRRGLIDFARREVHPNPLHFELVPHADVVGALTGRRVLSTVLAAPPARLGVTVLHRAEPPRSTGDRVPEVLDALAAVIGAWAPSTEDEGTCVLLAGGPGSGRTTHARDAAVRCGKQVLEAHCAALDSFGRDGAELLEALCRESAVHGDVVVLRDAGNLLAPDSPWAARLRALLSRLPALVVCCVEGGQRLHSSMLGGVRLRLQLDWSNTPDARHALLEETLGGHSGSLRDVDRHRLNALTPHQLQHVARVLDAHGSTPTELPRPELELAIHSQLLADTGGLATVSQPDLKLSELVLPGETLNEVEHVIAAVRNRVQVLHGWGLSRRLRRGIGICCLFDGEPGTGKTLAAEVIAGELGLQLLRIDLSNIVDKYVGETEKHLTRVFDKAQPDTSILLFDEADALFSKRTEVKSSHDHYANMSINVLLQLIEAYEGVSVLTTNLQQSIDPAFERRIMFKVPFPMPEAEERERLWRHLLPVGIPTEGELDFETLSEVEMSGGSIKNAILRAAYGCAHDGRELHTDALLDAAWSEASASGRLVRQDVEFEH